jgi:SET domain-containing protein
MVESLLPQTSPAVRIGRSPAHGRGVLATRAIEPGEVIDCAPVLIVPAEQRHHFDRTTLSEHCFEWTDGAVALPAGPTAFLNHDDAPNARAELDLDDEVVVITAVAPIAADEEVTIDYRDGDAEVVLWFDVA